MKDFEVPLTTENNRLLAPNSSHIRALSLSLSTPGVISSFIDINNFPSFLFLCPYSGSSSSGGVE
eukprot:m.180148 g.180148  ORF g.180148 m.180148 type:complete len:65 (+) comp39237_c0_seq53:286-480(+)